MAKISDVEVPSFLLDEQGSDPTTPATGFWRLYAKAAGLFHRDDAGAVTGPLLDETDHDALDHTGLTGVGGLQNFVGCRLYHSTTQSHASSGSYVSVLFDTEERDTDAFHDTGSNTSRITIPSGKGGTYFVEGHVLFAANATGNRSLLFKINNTTFVRGHVSTMTASGSIGANLYMAAMVPLAVGDYIEVQAYQNSGGSLNIGHASSEPDRNMFGATLIAG